MNRRQFLQTTAAGLSVGGCSGSVDFGPEADPFSDPAIRPLLATALTAATEAGARYADARLSHHRDQRISTREARVTRTSDTRSTGIGIRVLFDGTWGFAATPNLTTEAIVATAQRAIDIARSNSQLQQAAVRLAPMNADYRYNLGIVFEHLGQFDAARGHYQAARSTVEATSASDAERINDRLQRVAPEGAGR